MAAATDQTREERMATESTSILFPRFYAGFFTSEAELVALGQAKISLFIAVLRKIILLIPLALVLPRFMGVMGVYWAEPVSDAISATVATLLFALNIRKILSKEALAKIR